MNTKRLLAIALLAALAGCGGGGNPPPCPEGYYEAIVGTEYDYTTTPMRVLPITACVPEGFDPWGQPLPKK